MPIEGPIQDLGVSDLLQLVALSRRTGRLIASAPGEGDIVVTLWIEEGGISGLAGSPIELRLGRLAMNRENVAEDEVERALARQQLSPLRRLGELLLEQKALDEGTIRALLRFQIEEALSDILRWEEGTLRFQDEPPRAPGAVDLHLPIDAVLLDATRRIDELGEILGGISATPRLADQGGAPPAGMSLTPDEWRTLAEIDGSSSVQVIARRLARGELEVARSLKALAEASVIELTHTDESEPVLPEVEQGFDGGSLLRQATAALDSGALVEAAKQVAQLMARDPHSAPVHTLAALVAYRAGRTADAVEKLERAVGIDPLHEAAYFHLAAILVHQGELHRGLREIEIFLDLAATDHPLHERGRAMRSGLAQTLDALGGAS